MSHHLKLVLLSFIFTLCSVNSYAQNEAVQVEKILVEGNKKTKEWTVLRELDFAVNDSIGLDELISRLKFNEQLLLNTGLFTEAKLNVRDWDKESYQVSIHIALKEAWYIFPIPVFELADRNFNVWWQEFNLDLNRVNYGLRFYYSNITGRGDLLKLVGQIGYTRKYELEYTLPSFDSNPKIGFYSNILYSQNREAPFQTIANRVTFYRDSQEDMFRRFRLGAGLTYRPKLRQFHRLKLHYHHRSIADTVAVLNPLFFTGNNKQRFFSATYQWEFDRRDIKAYPLTGYYIDALFEKRGLGIFKDVSTTAIYPSFHHFISFDEAKKWSLAYQIKAKVSLERAQQPYYEYRALGYENDFIRGYELYVMDGLDFAFLKTSLRYEILNRTINWKKAMPLKPFRIMPLKLYVKAHMDWGYVNDPFYEANNSLVNKSQLGAGIGIDIVAFLDKVLQVEYSINRLGEKGLYLHFELSF